MTRHAIPELLDAALGIAYVAGERGFSTPNSADKFDLFVVWADEFESSDYDEEDFPDSLREFAHRKIAGAEVQHG